MIPHQSNPARVEDAIAAPAVSSPAPSQAAGCLIVNADDWGRDREITDRILDCIVNGSVSSVSAMVFTPDAERAASLAREHGIDAGLHLNFTLPFSPRHCPAALFVHQQRIARFLRSSRFAPAIFHPGLMRSFRVVVQAQLDEFERLYGFCPRRIDGHHHMHLAANVHWQKLLPARTIVRRNFSFVPGEKSFINRVYRYWQDRLLARHHRMTDFFFDILPLERHRLERIAALGRAHSVEIETHPADAQQYDFLKRGELAAMCPGVEIARGFQLRDPDFLIPVQPQAGQNAPRKSTPAARPHICICVCTYKRPVSLQRLLRCLRELTTEGLFTWSIVVVDNDEACSAESIAREAQSSSAVAVNYRVEPVRGIARARNKAVASAEGDYFAMIDDDEFPAPDWLLKLFTTCNSYNVDGVFGPVMRHFDEPPPTWLQKSRLYVRRVNPTGMRVQWREARTGNVLVKRSVFAADTAPFRPEFKSGEDQDFFQRKIAEGRTFVWCAEAKVFETLPPSRWTRKYYVRRALFHGAHAALQPGRGAINILKSMIAIPAYALALPVALLGGQHRFMALLVKLCDHAGQLLFTMRLNPIREEYLRD